MNREISHRLVLVLIALLAVVPVLYQSRTNGTSAVPAAFSVSPSSHITVGLRGDIPHPGIYHMPVNSMTMSAISLAEAPGAISVMFPPGIGALPLKNGAELSVTHRPDGSLSIARGSLTTQQRLVLGIPLDINVMQASDFDRIPGIGPALAERIVTYRQLNGGKMAVSELINVEGIGEKKFSQLKKYF